MTMPTSDITDANGAAQGRDRIEWAERAMPVLAAIRERFEPGAAAGRRAHLGLPARHRGDREPGAHARGRAAPACACAPSTRCRPRTTSPPRWRCTSTASPCSRSSGEDNDDLLPAHRGRARPPAAAADGRRRRPGDAASTRPTSRWANIRRRHRGDDHRRHPPARDGPRRRAALPGDRRQRREHQAHVRQPLRHRPDARSTGSSARPTCCSPARASSSCGYGWCGRGAGHARGRAWARTSS